MRKLGKSRKIGISVAVACCMLLAIIFSADVKNLFAVAANALFNLISADETTDTSNTIVMRTDDAYETDGYYAFSVYAPSTATYTIGVTAENGSVRVNTGEAVSVNEEMSVSLTKGTNVLYIMECDSPSIQWDRETCNLEPINKVCALVAGDLDQNGTRTLEELIQLKKEAKEAGTITTGTFARTKIADIDGDSSITNEDARLLRELLVGNPRYEASELRPVIVDAYLADTDTMYDSLADAIEAASEISVSGAKDVTVTVLNPTDVKLTGQVSVDSGAQITLRDDGAEDNGWSRTITRGSENAFKMFTVADATLTLTGSSGSDEHSSLILDGGAIANGKNHIVDVGWTPSTAKSGTLTMNAGVKLTNNINNASNSGGGALAIKYTFNMNGGIISGNINAGNSGAINLGTSGTTMNMTGGIITENETQADIHSAGGVNISNGASLIMTGGEIYGNIAPDSVGCNSVRKSSETSTLQMGGSAYIDRVCFDNTSVDTHCMELTSELTTDQDISLFFTQPLCEANVVVKGASYYSEDNSPFKLSGRMLPCKLELNDGNLCLRSDITGMDTVKATSVYSNYNFDSTDWRVQGVCTNGTYLYMAIAKIDNTGCKILRVDLGTWANPTLSDFLYTDHSNEMTYNSVTEKIYITHCTSSGANAETAEDGPYYISVMDPDTLTVESLIKLDKTTAYTGKTGIYALAYNTTQQYYVGGGTGFRFGFLKDGNGTITECAMPNTGLAGFVGYTGHIKQGVYATDTTIYTNTWYDITNVDDEEMNFITMYDWSGNYNDTKLVVNSDGTTPFAQEIESMFEYGEAMYMACIPAGKKGVDIYQLEDVGTAESIIDVQDSTGSVVYGAYNLSDAITKANELGMATLVLKSDVTVGETQTITGNVTIKDNGTARTITRQGFTDQMFVVADGAGLTFTATGTDKTSPTLTIDGNGEVVGASGAMVSLGTGSGTLAVNNAVRFTNANINEDGGIIRTEAGSTAKVTINGGVFDNNTAEVAGALNGGLIKVVGEAEATISNALFENNEISSTGGALKGGIVYIGNTSTVNVVGSTFTSNTAYTNSTGSGGVIGVYDSGTLHVGKYVNASDETIEGDCYFTDNTFSSYNGYRAYGGVFTVSGGSANVCNSIATGNTADYGGVVSVGGSYTLTVEDCTFEQNEAPTDPNTKDLRAAGTVIFKGKVKTNVYCTAVNRLKVNSQLTEGSKIIVAGAADKFVEDATVVTFASEEIMADCQAKGYFVLKGVTYGLKYETTSDSKHIAKLVNVVAMVGEEEYASLASAVEAANALDSATIVLKADVTVGATQTIEGNVTITDDGTPRKITREDEFTDQMFVVASDAGLTFTATGTDKTSPTLTIDGNNVGPSGAMVSLGTGNGTLAVNNAVRFTNANINEDGGIIRTEDGTTATVTINGGVFDSNTVAVSGDVYGGLIIADGEAVVTISDALFQNNAISSTKNLVKGGILYVKGGTMNVVGSTFTSNTAYTYRAGGGLIRVDNGTLNIGKYINEASETIEGACYFTDNIFSSYNGKNAYGGVIAVGGGNAQVYNSTFERNTADYGGTMSVNNGYTLTVGNCTLSDNIPSDAEPESKDIRTSGNVIFEGKVNTTVYCVNANRLQVNSRLTEGSQITVVMRSWTEGNTVVAFASEEIMADCQANGYLSLTNEGYTLNYATSGSTHTAKLASVVATIGEQGYASLADAIEAANALDSATIVLKADVTVGATQTIEGNVTITDDGTARTITREEGFTDQMFVVADGAGLTFTATGEDKASPTLTIDGNKATVGASGAMVSLGSGSGTLAVNNAVQFTNANINEDGGIIRTEDGTTAKVTINGGVFADNTAEVSGALNGGLIISDGEAVVTISDALFQNNAISSTENGVRGGIVYIGGGTVNVVGSTFTDNTVYTTKTGAGGVIAVYGGTLNVGKYINAAGDTIEADCYFTDNTFSSSNNKNSYGGVFTVSGGSANVCNSTATGNSADHGGVASVGTGYTLTVEDCTFQENEALAASDEKDLRAAGTIIFKGQVNTTVYSSGENKLRVNSQLTEGSQITVVMSGWVDERIVVTFESEEIMADCQANGYLVLTNEGYTLNYTTSDSTYVAKLASVVATIGEQGYASLADAIEAANALDSAIIVLKADVTVGATQTITGNVTITDDGTARKITREEGFTDQMFVVADGAGLTFTAMGTNNTSPTLTIDGNGEAAGASGAMVSLGSGSGTLAVNNAVQFTNANINEDGGIIRTEDGSTAKVTINGGIFANNTAEVAGDVYGGLINVVGSAEVTISNALFQNNAISSTTKLVKGGILYVDGGTMNVVGSTFTSNTAYTTTAGGGLIRVDSGTLNIGKYVNATGETIEGACYFTNNNFSSYNGKNAYGGVIALGNDASAQVYNSTFTSNTAELGNISINKGATLTIGDSELNNLTTSTTEPDSKDIRVGNGGAVIFEGKVNTTVYCVAANCLDVNSQLTEGSEITITGSATAMALDNTLVSFTGDNAADVMADCKANGYLKVASEDYTLVYDTTDNIAKIASVVATIEEEKYVFLSDAITAANALETTAESPATIVLKADVTVGATQTITGNVTITDDGTAKTITRGTDCTAQMFDVQEGASLTLAGTGTLAEDSEAVQGTITVDGDKANVTATASMIVNAGTFSLGTNASLTNAGNVDIEYGGALYNTGTATLEGTLSGNEGGRGGAIYNSNGMVTFSSGEFSGNTASVHGAVIMSLKGTVDITGGTFTDNTANDRGGVILSNGATVTISGGEFLQNEAKGTTGGGVFGGTTTAVLNISGGTFSGNTASNASAGGGVIESNGAVTIDGGIFEANSAFEGGVFHMDTSGALTINAGEFYGNTTTNATDAAGGVIYIANNTLSITGGTFGAEDKGNVSYQRGGVIYIADRDTAPAEANISIKNATFSYNSAQHGSKASSGFMYVGKNSIVDIEACIIDHNEVIDTDTSAQGIYYWAGAMYVDSSVVNVTGTNFNYNKAGTGGAVYVTGATGQVTVIDSDFSNNTVTAVTSLATDVDGLGGAIYVAGGTVEIKNNSTFTDNSAFRGGAIGLSGSGALTISDCEFADNSASGTFGRDVYYNSGSLTLSGKIGNARIDKREHVINVVDELEPTSTIEIMQISGDGKNDRVQVQFESASATEIGAQCISYYEYYNTVNSGLTLQFDTETYQAIMK